MTSDNTTEQSPASAMDAASLNEQVGHSEGWRLIESAPHNEEVLLFCPDRGYSYNRARVELGYASQGTRNDVGSSISIHSWATHWMPLPAPPAATIKNVGDE